MGLFRISENVSIEHSDVLGFVETKKLKKFVNRIPLSRKVSIYLSAEVNVFTALPQELSSE